MFEMSDSVEKGRRVSSFPEARYAVDVSFLQCYHPSGSMEMGKKVHWEEYALWIQDLGISS